MDQTRKSYHHFTDRNEENLALIYNYPTNFTALVNSVYEQCYLFDENAFYRQPNGKKIG